LKTYDPSRLKPVDVNEEIKAVSNLVQSQWDCSNIFHRNPEINTNPVESLVKYIYEKINTANEFGTSLHASTCLPDYQGQRSEYLSRELNVQYYAIQKDATYNFILNATLGIDSYNGDLYDKETCNMQKLAVSILNQVSNDFVGIEKTYPPKYSEFLDIFTNVNGSGYNESEKLVKEEVLKFSGHTEFEGEIPNIVAFSSIFNVAFDDCEENRKPAYTLIYNIGRHFLTVCQFNNECAIRKEFDSINHRAIFSNDELKPSLPILSNLVALNKYHSPLIKIPEQDALNLVAQSRALQEQSKLKDIMQNGTADEINKSGSTPSSWNPS
jgi:hypothetical protein